MATTIVEGLALVIFEPPEKAIDELSLRRVMEACAGQGVEALVVLQATMGDGRLAPTLAHLWPHSIILWATPEKSDADMISIFLAGFAKERVVRSAPLESA